ncbi:uncharacterized protein LOC128397500 [Panonychus citri]|uniref:uncharacterized protein LOC128397500 n=1 Tax=Panonychus citri TaxID=50023 RepID=UPI002307A77F|nr:uncharacterized protein LOC128397500 [Panonychus citri]XP_053214202.1 uncharacterized protein LOC128397500 [Panonychus citri]XP_053214203.1 uncharacterized protein LOC128397500 [Panonychus citri]XP_053214204.1 uncharacterized protein LOC128397500 [Panonychus citri]XP_053214205.1 uncharacterized protein LOC128397500 [Panonychus citri]XP_053214206.1 uncharacterized protein LOC128397500 [Panonychus citri]XP_053214207.1 uncharacterized protein LOC128397500 [Panonychus citri]XP_053214208.1 unc
MEDSNSLDCMIMDDDDDDLIDEPISLNDLRLMFAKLQEMHSKDEMKEMELKRKLAEVESSSIVHKLSRLRNEVEEIKDKIESVKKENKTLSSFDLDLCTTMSETLYEAMDKPLEIMYKCSKCYFETVKDSENLHVKSTITKHCQTELTFPPSFTSFTSSPPCSSSLVKERPFNAQDAFIEIQLDRKRQLEEQLKQLKKQMWYEGPEVMLVKLDAYEKMLVKSSIRPRKKVQRNQFDCFLEISDNLEKRPRLETSRPTSPSSTNNSNGTKMDEVVQLFFTAPPKQTNGQGSQNHT